jgi:predicted dehydrogenase
MLKGGVIGFGRMGLTHFSVLNTHPDVKFVAVCVPSSFVLKNVESFLGLAPYKDYRKMFSETRPDFAIVATPTGMHAEVVVGTGPMITEDDPTNASK